MKKIFFASAALLSSSSLLPSLQGCGGEFYFVIEDSKVSETTREDITINMDIFDIDLPLDNITDQEVADDQIIDHDSTPPGDIITDQPPPETISDTGPDDTSVEPEQCSGHGTLMDWPEEGETVCACDPGYTPSSPAGNDCVPTETVCKGGTLRNPIDVDGDDIPDSTFEPTALECKMYELINYTRATHDPEGSPECHFPLMYNLEWSARARNHSLQMFRRGALFHDDYPSGQNCAYGCSPECEMDMYMNGPGEGHCPPLSHHCNIMRCSFTEVGIGYWTPDGGTWNTQNFL